MFCDARPSLFALSPGRARGPGHAPQPDPPSVLQAGEQRAEGTGRHTEIRADLVLKSIGYKSTPLEGVPWDDKAAVARNVNGRVVEEGGEPVPGMYVCGWVRCGGARQAHPQRWRAASTVRSVGRSRG